MARKRVIDPHSPEGIEASLRADEEERKRRDKYTAKYCPVCGRKPEIPLDKAGRHIYTGNCEKCQCGFVVHINA